MKTSSSPDIGNMFLLIIIVGGGEIVLNNYLVILECLLPGIIFLIDVLIIVFVYIELMVFYDYIEASRDGEINP